MVVKLEEIVVMNATNPGQVSAAWVLTNLSRAFYPPRTNPAEFVVVILAIWVHVPLAELPPTHPHLKI